MSTLTELQAGRRQAAGDHRRWFYSPDMDLIVWYGARGFPVAFELYYDKKAGEHVLIWRSGKGFCHMAVDDGENKPVLNYKEAPILIPDGEVDALRIKRLFERSCAGLPAELVELVVSRLGQFQGPGNPS